MFEPTALRGCRLFESNDLDAARHRLSTILRPHSVKRIGGAGQAKAHIETVRFAGTTVSTISYGTAIHLSTRSHCDYYAIFFCLRGEAEAHVDGEPTFMNSTRAITMHPGGTLDARFSPDCEQLHVRIEAQAFAAHTGGRQIRFPRSVDLRQQDFLPWAEQLRGLVTSSSLLGCLQRRGLAAMNMERLLIQLLLAGQSPIDLANNSRPSIAPGCVVKAEAFMKHKLREPIRLRDIAAAAGVPSRTLHHSFRRFRESTPMQYLTELRLERAHELLQSQRRGLQVVDVALECGFIHLGRFASYYRRRFGEAPSETIKKARH